MHKTIWVLHNYCGESCDSRTSLKLCIFYFKFKIAFFYSVNFVSDLNASHQAWLESVWLYPTPQITNIKTWSVWTFCLMTFQVRQILWLIILLVILTILLFHSLLSWVPNNTFSRKVLYGLAAPCTGLCPNFTNQSINLRSQ